MTNLLEEIRGRCEAALGLGPCSQTASETEEDA